MATAERFALAEQLLFNKSINEAIDALKGIGKEISVSVVINCKVKEREVRPLVTWSYVYTVQAPLEGSKEEGTKVKELAILKLGQVLASNGFAEGK